jgi:hypothetical protein
MPLEDDIRDAMIQGQAYVIEFDQALNARAAGNLPVYLHAIPGGARIDLTAAGGEPATILWLPWRQGMVTEIQAATIAAAPNNRLFFTYYLSGCKVFAIQGGPVWHIDAPVSVAEFWPEILDDLWVEQNWEPGTAQQVAYIHRAGQNADLWDLSAYLAGGAPTTYGNGNVGQAIVGGVMNNAQLDYYYQSSPWQVLPYATQTMKKS